MLLCHHHHSECSCCCCWQQYKSIKFLPIQKCPPYPPLSLLLISNIIKQEKKRKWVLFVCNLYSLLFPAMPIEKTNVASEAIRIDWDCHSNIQIYTLSCYYFASRVFGHERTMGTNRPCCYYCCCCFLLNCAGGDLCPWYRHCSCVCVRVCVVCVAIMIVLIMVHQSIWRRRFINCLSECFPENIPCVLSCKEIGARKAECEMMCYRNSIGNSKQQMFMFCVSINLTMVYQLSLRTFPWKCPPCIKQQRNKCKNSDCEMQL